MRIEAVVEKISLKDLIIRAVREYLRKAGVPDLEADLTKEA